MKKCLIPVTMLLSAVLLTGLFSCTKDDDGRDERAVEMGCENFWQVTDEIDEYYNECTSLDEFVEYLPVIKKIENVENAYVSGTSLFVTIKGFGTTSYAFFDQIEDEEAASRINEQLQEFKTRAVIDRTYINPDYDLMTGVVSNAQYNDMPWTRAVSDVAVAMLNDIGVETEPNDDPDIDFFLNQIFKYDVVFHIGHGEYDANQKLHWFITPKIVSTKKQLESLREQYTEKQVSTVTYEKKKYIKISEKLYDSCDKRFKKPGRAIFFSVPCQSLKGENYIISGDYDERDFAFADALKSRGLGLYLGYDETNARGQMAGLLFLGKLASGMNIDYSYKTLPYKYLYDKVIVRTFYIIDNVLEHWEHITAELLTSYADEYPELPQATLTRPVMGEIVGQNSQGGESLMLSASAILFRSLLIDKKINEDYKTVYDDYLDDFKYTAFEYGFEYSDSPDFKNAIRLSKMKVDSEDKVNKAKCSYSSNRVKLSQTVSLSSLKGNTNYYFRAYFYDGQGNYNYSDYKEFKMTEKLIDQVIPDDIRKTMEPYITFYEGDEPPIINGTYVINPMEVVHDATGYYKTGDQLGSLYIRFSNQTPTKNTLDYQEMEITNSGKLGSESKGEGAFISGEGNNFSVYFNISGITHWDTYDVQTKEALVISGTKTNNGIKNLRYSFIMVEKGSDPDKVLMNKGDFRVVKDAKELAKTATWPSLTRELQITIDKNDMITPWSRHACTGAGARMVTGNK